MYEKLEELKKLKLELIRVEQEEIRNRLNNQMNHVRQHSADAIKSQSVDKSQSFDRGSVRCLYRATSDLELTVLKGERVRVETADTGDGWTQVRTESNLVGFIPTSFIKFDPIQSCDRVVLTQILSQIKP